MLIDVESTSTSTTAPSTPSSISAQFAFQGPAQMMGTQMMGTQMMGSRSFCIFQPSKTKPPAPRNVTRLIPRITPSKQHKPLHRRLPEAFKGLQGRISEAHQAPQAPQRRLLAHYQALQRRRLAACQVVHRKLL